MKTNGPRERIRRLNRLTAVRRFAREGPCLLGISARHKPAENFGRGRTGGGKRAGFKPSLRSGEYCCGVCEDGGISNTNLINLNRAAKLSRKLTPPLLSGENLLRRGGAARPEAAKGHRIAPLSSSAEARSRRSVSQQRRSRRARPSTFCACQLTGGRPEDGRHRAGCELPRLASG
jgi:hypothetical protein